MHVYADSGSKVKALGLIAALAVVFAIVADRIFQALNVGPSWLVSAPTVAASFGILYGIMERRAWSWKALRLLGVVDTLPVSGSYDGELTSSYNGTKLPVAIEIEQSWTRIIVKFRVSSPQSSTSVSLGASLARVGNEDARLTYFYRNSVSPGVAEIDMNDHDGTAELLINFKTGVASGRYYNYRGRQGDLNLTRSQV